MKIPAVVTAGDRVAAKAVRGESKVYLELAGRPLVAHAVLVLQDVPEVSEVWVVGDVERLRGALECPEVASQLVKPLHLVEQFDNLYENAWQTYRRLLPGAGESGRDPDPDSDDLDTDVLYLSGDIPFATPQEISQFVQRSRALDCDYAVGLVLEHSLEAFRPGPEGQPGIEFATFNLREGRFRQSNLHWVKPARIRNLVYIEELYEHRHQRELWPILSLAWRLLWLERGGFTVLWYYSLMHLAGLADRRRLRGLADGIRRTIPMPRIERGCSDLLGTRFRFVATDLGGCAVDIDMDEHYDAARSRFEEWRAAQSARAAQLAQPSLAPGAGSEPSD